MTEPTSAAAGAAAGALVALPWALLGINPQLLGVGLFCALLISLWLPSVSTRRRAFAAVLLSGLAAGALPPVLATLLAAQITSLADSHDALLVPLALLIGTGGPTLIPSVLAAGKARLDRETAK